MADTRPNGLLVGDDQASATTFERKSPRAKKSESTARRSGCRRGNEHRLSCSRTSTSSTLTTRFTAFGTDAASAADRFRCGDSSLDCKGRRRIPSLERRNLLGRETDGFVSCTPAGVVEIFERPTSRQRGRDVRDHWQKHDVGKPRPLFSCRIPAGQLHGNGSVTAGRGISGRIRCARRSYRCGRPGEARDRPT